MTAILYTSGSTGIPKGAVFTEELVLPSEGVAVLFPFVRLDFQEFDPSLLLSILSTMQCGGSRAIATNLVTLMDDIEVSRPTHIGATPIFWNFLYQEFQQKVFQKTRENTNPQKTHDEIEEESAKELRAKLGNRLHVASCGGAPVSQQVLDFAKKRLKIDIVNLYGSRETGGRIFFRLNFSISLSKSLLGISRDGRIYGGIDVQLLSLPDLGYFSDGNPPRVSHETRLFTDFVREKFVSSRQDSYRDTGKTQKIQKTALSKLEKKFTIELVMLERWKYGYVFWADCERSDDRKVEAQNNTDPLKGASKHVKIIDRAKFFLKLAQGEWLSPSRVELILEQSPWIQQSLVFAYPTQTCCVAVIVPSELFWKVHGNSAISEGGNNDETNSKLTEKMLEELR
ncbi:AMP-binding protein [Patescibacteria group bacterium]|nr:AMP-binding protein [Patescibacteria group bacterium]